MVIYKNVKGHGRLRMYVNSDYSHAMHVWEIQKRVDIKDAQSKGKWEHLHTLYSTVIHNPIRARKIRKQWGKSLSWGDYL